MHTITLLLQSYDFSKKMNELLLVKYAKQALYAKEMRRNFTLIAVQTKSFPKRRLYLRYYMNACSRLLGKQSKKEYA